MSRLRTLGAGRARYLLLHAAIIALPFSYLPHEFGVVGLSITPGVAALVLAAGVQHRVYWRWFNGFEWVAAGLTAWIAIRLLVIAPLVGEQMNIRDAASALGTMLVGLTLFRLAQDVRLRDAIRRSLVISLGLLLLIEAYQLIAGLPWLRSLGYTDGFYFTTADGSYRPFGTFLSPTVFGAYLAMLGVAVVALHRRATLAIWLVLAAAGVVLTQTRAAWIALFVGVAVVFIRQWRRPSPGSIPWRRVLAWAAPVAVALVIFLAFAAPSIVGRVAALFGDADTSRDSRFALWSAVLRASLGAPIGGYGQGSFLEIVGPIAGEAARFGHAHQNFLQVLFMYGYVGLLLLVVLLAVAAIGIWRHSGFNSDQRYSGAALGGLAAFIADSFFETTWTSLSVVGLLFLIIGLGYKGMTSEPGRVGDRAEVDASL